MYCIDHVELKKVVKRNWDVEYIDNPFYEFKRKIK